MRDKFRYLTLGLSMSFVLKIAVLGATWQEIAALGLVSVLAMYLQGIKDEAERSNILRSVESLEVELAEAKKTLQANSDSLTALKMNSGITSRRL